MLHWEKLESLVLVAGHAVYTGHDFSAPDDDTNWFLQPFQEGEPPFYIEHMVCGVELAAADRRALLVYSGGQTRREAGARSEAQSYWVVSDHYSWWYRPGVALRCTTEEYARDSFENLLFGIARFRECTGRYPRNVDVVSWAFKAERFEQHREAISYPADRFTFVGVNDPVDLDGARRGEKKAVDAFKADCYGTEVEEEQSLGRKRMARNPFRRCHPYSASCPEIKLVLDHKSSMGKLNFQWGPLLEG